MKYKMIVSDFDGTLLRSDHTVSEKSVKAIKKYIAKGGTFVVSTGRMALSLDGWKDYLGISGQKVPVIGFNGSVVTDDDGNAIASTCIDAQTAYKIVKKAMELNVYCHIYDVKNVYIKNVNYINHDYTLITGAPLKVVGRLDEFLLKHPDMMIPKIMLVINPERREELERIYDEMNIEGVQHVMSSKHFFEFVSTRAGKGNGMKMASEVLGIPLDEIIAIGDNQNDVSMIEMAGLGVAVGNAREELKAVADYVAGTNNDDPIAEVIEKFCGGENE